jgi:hypothetical protein
MSINSLGMHYKNTHDWRTRPDGKIDPSSNPLGRKGGVL